jgi:hypothetical protein
VSNFLNPEVAPHSTRRWREATPPQTARRPKNIATLIDSLYLSARHKSGLFSCSLSCETGPASITILADAVPGLIVGGA